MTHQAILTLFLSAFLIIKKKTYMFDLQTPKQPSEDAIIVQNVSKHFRIPHEKRTKLFEHITGALKGTASTYEEFWQ